MQCSVLLQTKGADYTDGQDRLSSFKDIARRSGQTPLQVWYTYFAKHVSSIEAFIRTGRVQSESIGSRFVDARNYIDLGYALVKEREALDDCPVDAPPSEELSS